MNYLCALKNVGVGIENAPMPHGHVRVRPNAKVDMLEVLAPFVRSLLFEYVHYYDKENSRSNASGLDQYRSTLQMYVNYPVRLKAKKALPSLNFRYADYVAINNGCDS